VQLDGELEDARWFDLEQLRGAEEALLPPPYTIARRLIDAWCRSRPPQRLARNKLKRASTRPLVLMICFLHRRCPAAAWLLLAVLLSVLRPAMADIRIELEGVDGDVRRNVLAL